MTAKKYYYSLIDISILLDLSIDELMHYGITGQLGMFFDWALIKSEISIKNLPLSLTIKYIGQPPHLWEGPVNDMLKSEHIKNPNERLFPLSTGQLSVINKNGFINLIHAYDDFDGSTLEIVKKEGSEQVEYPILNLSSIIVTSFSYEQFVKDNQLNKADKNDCFDGKEAFENDNIPNRLYFTIGLNKEVWPIPGNMNLPSKTELAELVMAKDSGLCRTDIDAIIRLSTPDDIILGGKKKKDKIPFAPVHLR